MIPSQAISRLCSVLFDEMWRLCLGDMSYTRHRPSMRSEEYSALCERPACPCSPAAPSAIPGALYSSEQERSTQPKEGSGAEVVSASGRDSDEPSQTRYIAKTCITFSAYLTFSYSALACFRMGTSGSAFFHMAKKSWYATRLRASSPSSA